MLAEATLALHLACFGTGDRPIEHRSSGFAYDNNGNTVTGFGTTRDRSQFGEQMDIDIADGSARVRVPRRFLPPAHGGDGGWFDVKDLLVSENEIVGTVTINFIQHPKMRIDRRTGTINLDGKVGSFAGQCRPYSDQPRAF